MVANDTRFSRPNDPTPETSGVEGISAKMACLNLSLLLKPRHLLFFLVERTQALYSCYVSAEITKVFQQVCVSPKFGAKVFFFLPSLGKKL